MLLEVKVCPIGYTLKLRPPEWELILYVRTCLGVMSELILGMFALIEILFFDPQLQVPVKSLIHPSVIPLFICAGLHEKLYLHLLKFPGAECKITCGNFVTE